MVNGILDNEVMLRLKTMMEPIMFKNINTVSQSMRISDMRVCLVATFQKDDGITFFLSFYFLCNTLILRNPL